MRPLALIVILILLLPSVGQSQLYNRSSEFFDARLQHHSTTTRGGISMYTPPYPSSQTLYQGNLTVRSVCGFDFDFNVIEQIAKFLETAPEQLEALIPGILYVLLCQFYPSACDAFKHIQGYVNQTLRFLKGDCQQLMQLGHLAGIANRSEAEAACVQEQLADHGNIELAINTCSVGLANLRGPNGVSAPNINVLDALLDTMPVEPAIREAMVSALPNLELSTNGPLFRESASAEPDISVKKVATETLEFELKINEALTQLASTGEVVGGLQYLGGSIPNLALYGMLKMDSVRRDHEVKKMASNMGLAKTIYDLLQAASHLNTAMQVSSLSASQRQHLERGYDYLIKEVQRLKLQKSIPDITMHEQVSALLQYNAEHEAWAAKAIQRHPTRGKSHVMLPETGQDTFGIPR